MFVIIHGVSELSIFQTAVYKIQLWVVSLSCLSNFRLCLELLEVLLEARVYADVVLEDDDSGQPQARDVRMRGVSICPYCSSTGMFTHPSMRASAFPACTGVTTSVSPLQLDVHVAQKAHIKQTPMKNNYRRENTCQLGWRTIHLKPNISRMLFFCSADVCRAVNKHTSAAPPRRAVPERTGR